MPCEWERIHSLIKRHVSRNGTIVQYPDLWLTMEQVRVCENELDARRFEEIITLRLTNELTRGVKGIPCSAE